MWWLCLKKVSTYQNQGKNKWERALLQFSWGAPEATERPPPASEPAGTFFPPTPPKSRALEVPQLWLCPVSFAGVCPFPSVLSSWPWPSSSLPGLSSPPLFFFWTMIKGQPFRRYLLGIFSPPHSFPTAQGVVGVTWTNNSSFRFPGISHC